MYFNGKPERRQKAVTGKPGAAPRKKAPGSSAGGTRVAQDRGHSTTTAAPPPRGRSSHQVQPSPAKQRPTKPQAADSEDEEGHARQPRIPAHRSPQRQRRQDHEHQGYSDEEGGEESIYHYRQQQQPAPDRGHDVEREQRLEERQARGGGHKVLRHMLSSLSEDFGGGYCPPAELLQPRRGPPAVPPPLAHHEAVPPASLLAARRRQQAARQEEEWSSGAGGDYRHATAAAGREETGNYQQRSIARLGGDGVASIFRGGGGGGAGSLSAGGGKAAGGSYMSALHDLKPGLSDAQKSKVAAAREQLKRDLEQQMAERRAAEARRKAELAAQEEEEEARIREYYARVAREQAAEQSKGVDPAPAMAPVARAAVAGGGGPGAQQQRGRRESQVSHALHPASKPSKPEAATPGMMVRVPRERSKAAQRHVASPPPVAEVESEESRGDVAVMAGHAAGVSAPQLAGQHAALLEQQRQQQQQQLWASPYGAALVGLPAAHQLVVQQAAAVAVLPPAYHLPLMAPPPLVPGSAPVAAAVPRPQPVPDAASLLQSLQSEQARLAQQLASQAEVVGHLQGDVLSAQRERDRAREDLARVQALLLTRAGQGQQPGPARGCAGSYGMQEDGYYGGGGGLELHVSSHLLPAGQRCIPSRLGTPNAGAGGFAAFHHPSAAAPVHRQQVAPPQRVPGKGVAAVGRAGAGGAASSKSAGRAGVGGAPSKRTGGSVKQQQWRK